MDTDEYLGTELANDPEMVEDDNGDYVEVPANGPAPRITVLDYALGNAEFRAVAAIVSAWGKPGLTSSVAKLTSNEQSSVLAPFLGLYRTVLPLHAKHQDDPELAVLQICNGRVEDLMGLAMMILAIKSDDAITRQTCLIAWGAGCGALYETKDAGPEPQLFTILDVV